MDKRKKRTIELLVLDSEKDRIHCVIKSPLVSTYERSVVEGKAYIMSNLDVEPNEGNYRATRHPCQIVFKRQTQIRTVIDYIIPEYAFEFTPVSMIRSGFRDDSFLIDFMGLLCGKSELKEFSKKPKSVNLLDIELDDLRLLEHGPTISTKVVAIESQLP
ncbi:hypothetical protein PIB30_001660 [Stylosanthes scabra]|uniref:Replication protein A 70 kDa DNA-binding subunit B/D first OB fold domain-containing protein n=1 Tax=Stylosanthes scabra TaxID=79078 RepID=A0ABU6T4K7_9FABA|nr:hypothetical protein [Stylosanthes scabra]